jgi:hypothetical protein
VKIALGLKPGLKISTPSYITSHNERYAMTETIERIVLASRPGGPTIDNFRSEKLPITEPGTGPDAFAHAMAFARPLHARPDERCAVLRQTCWHWRCDGPIPLPHLMRAILTKRLTFRGFIVSDFSARYGDFMRDVAAWIREGRIKYREDVVEGLENAPRALIGLLRGENFGKLLVRVARRSPASLWRGP